MEKIKAGEFAETCVLLEVFAILSEDFKKAAKSVAAAFYVTVLELMLHGTFLDAICSLLRMAFFL